MGETHLNMGDMAEMMNGLFDVIDIDGSGSIEEKEIIAAVLAMFASVEEGKSEEEQGAILGGAMFFLAGVAQLGESLGEDCTSCTREQWNAFEMKPIEGVSEDDFTAGLICFLGCVASALENKDAVQAQLREIADSPDFDKVKADF